jgi:hypothetical protein
VDELNDSNNKPIDNQSNGLADELSILGAVAGAVGSVAASRIMLDFRSREKTRNWWHSVLSSHGRYNCCAFFLILPSDTETLDYLKKYGSELHIISSTECLLMLISETEVQSSNFDETVWSKAVGEYVAAGHSIKIGRYFGIELTEFPCVIVFNDIRSTEHVRIKLKGLKTDEIAEKMRQLFSVIISTAAQKQSVLSAIEARQRTDSLKHKGAKIVSAVTSFAGKTIETVMEAYVKAGINP